MSVGIKALGVYIKSVFESSGHFASSAVNAGFSCGSPPSEGVFVWSLSDSEGGAAWVESGWVGVSEVAGGSVPSFAGFLLDVPTAPCSGRSLGTCSG